jgi:hypothetical protein
VIAELARTGPSALVGGADGFAVIDKVQSPPALFPCLCWKSIATACRGA